MRDRNANSCFPKTIPNPNREYDPDVAKNEEDYDRMFYINYNDRKPIPPIRLTPAEENFIRDADTDVVSALETDWEYKENYPEEQ